jgi:cold shock CspA family protein
MTVCTLHRDGWPQDFKEGQNVEFGNQDGPKGPQAARIRALPETAHFEFFCF